MGALESTHLQTACIKQVVGVKLEGKVAVAPAVASEVAVEIASAWYRVRPKAIDSAFLVELLVGQPGRTGQQSKPLF
jgi:hypothetical protein